MPLVHDLLVVDDHPVFRAGLCHLLDEESEFQVVGEAEDAPSALRMVRALRPHLVTVDLTLPGNDGLQLVKSLRSEWPSLSIVVVSVHSERVYGPRALQAGADGYLQKDRPWAAFRQGLRDVLRGQVVYSPSVLRGVVTRARRGQEDVSPGAVLTDRELEVFRALGTGRRLREVADALGVSLKTAESHVASIKRKLGIRHANELVHRATLFHGDPWGPTVDD